MSETEKSYDKIISLKNDVCLEHFLGIETDNTAMENAVTDFFNNLTDDITSELKNVNMNIDSKKMENEIAALSQKLESRGKRLVANPKGGFVVFKKLAKYTMEWVGKEKVFMTKFINVKNSDFTAETIRPLLDDINSIEVNKSKVKSLLKELNSELHKDLADKETRLEVVSVTTFLKHMREHWEYIQDSRRIVLDFGEFLLSVAKKIDNDKLPDAPKKDATLFRDAYRKFKSISDEINYLSRANEYCVKKLLYTGIKASEKITGDKIYS
jgi:ribosomal protein L12E/L44/L45/RPP1/RPP2